ncbi:MAG: hypothetical protein ACI9JM_000526 [Halioglobus sp.]|jgi:hypothetical protein
MEEKISADGSKDTTFAALLAATAVVVGFIIYWSDEIQAVREMLELAYG